MTYNSIKHLSLSLSVVFHALLLIAFFLITFSIQYPTKKYVELSFGKIGKEGSSGATGTKVTKVEKVPEVSKPQPKNAATNKSLQVKEVQLPEAVNTKKENTTQTADNTKDEVTEEKSETKPKTNADETSTAQGNKENGIGSLGYDIDWGGKGQRKIYSYTLPPYPKGVQKEIDIRLRFTILPDGTVGTIIPLKKADTRLENAAINSLRQWRFEPLAPSQKQVQQTAIIVFPYRLH